MCTKWNKNYKINKIKESTVAIHTFSTKDKDEAEVQKLKQHCKKRYINFSAMVIKAIAKLNEEIANEQQR